MDRSGQVNPNLPIDLRANRAFGDFQVEVGLQPDAELGRDAKAFAPSPKLSGSGPLGRASEIPTTVL